MRDDSYCISWFVRVIGLALASVLIGVGSPVAGQSPVRGYTNASPSDRDAASPAPSSTSAFVPTVSRFAALNPGMPEDVPGFPLYSNYTPAEYGEHLHSQNWSVAQDRDGVIYVANPSGVLAYDGVEWRLIPTNRQTLVRTVVQGPDGRIFVGAYSEIGYLAPDSSGVQRFTSLADELPADVREFGHVWSGVATSEGVFFQTRRYLFHWDGTAMSVHRTRRTGARFYELFAVRDTVYVSQESEGLRTLTNGRLHTVADGTRFITEGVTAVLPHGRDRLLVGTVDSRLYVRRNGRFEPFVTEADAFLQANELNDAAILPDGTYAFATLWGGVVILHPDGRTARVLDESAGLVDDDVKSLFVDRHDGLWLACENGLARVSVAQPLSLYDARAGLDGVALSVVRHRGAIHVGTSSGVFRLTRGGAEEGTVRPVFKRISGVRGQAFALLSTPQGLLAATDRGVYRFTDDGGKRVGPAQSAFGLHRSRHRPDRVFVGYIDGIGVLDWTGAAFQFARVDGLQKGIFFLDEDRTGHLWAASAYSGLWRLTVGEDEAGSAALADSPRRIPAVVQEVAAEGRTPQHVYRMVYLPDRGLRIVGRDRIVRPVAARDSAVLVPDRTLLQVLPESAGRVLNLVVAPDGDRWVFTPGQTFRLHTTSTGTEVHTPFALVPNFSVYAVMAEAQGRFWVAGEEGVIRHAPWTQARAQAPVFTLIRRVVASETDSVLFGGTVRHRGDSPATDDNDPWVRVAAESEDDLLRLDYALNGVRFQYAAAGFGRERYTQYRFRLQGFDDGWSPWTLETRKEYTNLPPGRYRFEVEARNPQVWTARPAAFAFVVRSPWYRTPWAYLGYVLLAAGVVAGLVRWRTASLERRRARLEHMVARRTSEVKEQARQLEAYNSELLRSNDQLQTAIEEKSKLLGVAAHDLKNPLFGIRALSEVLLEKGSFDDTVRRRIDLIRESADETLRLINDLLNSAASTAATSLETEMIEVGALAEWIVHGFRPQAERKRQELHCDLPEDPCIVRGDKRKIREAMNNLISNAIKYSPHGRPIQIRVERQSKDVTFSVTDDGPGLDAEDQRRMFAPFQRLTPEPTGDEGSSGLGLYIVKQIATLHGGEVEVESEVGEGSTFTLILPLASTRPSTGAPDRGDAVNAPDPVEEEVA